MPKDKKPSARDEHNAHATPWKNSLLSKERLTELQNPMNYFQEVIQNNDTFAILFEEILDRRDAGEVMSYNADGTSHLLCAFLVVQDRHGTNWICPVNGQQAIIEQDLHPLNMNGDDPVTCYLDKVSFGKMVIRHDDYVAACSRGFEHASRVFLGEQCVQLQPDYNLIAGFYFTSKKNVK